MDEDNEVIRLAGVERVLRDGEASGELAELLSRWRSRYQMNDSELRVLIHAFMMKWVRQGEV